MKLQTLLKKYKQEYPKDFKRLKVFLNTISKDVRPLKTDIFKCFDGKPKKLIILGMDPYPDPYNADGLCFSCKKNVSYSLSFLLDHFNVSYKKDKPFKLDLLQENGVLLLNSALTVEIGKPGSHSKHWKNFIILVLKEYYKSYKPVILCFGYKASQLASKANVPYMDEFHPRYLKQEGMPMNNIDFNYVNQKSGVDIKALLNKINQ